MWTRVQRVEAREAYEQLFRQAGPALWGSLYAFTGGRTDIAEDAMAEAFARAMERASTIRDPLAWIYRAAFRFAVEELKRERRQRAEVPELGVEHHVAELEDLRRAMQSLSPRQRLALILHCVEDLPVDEVARGTGLSPSTVRVHIHRGRNRIRRILGPKEVADG